MKIKNTTAIITGAASGLGLALARELDRRGARLLLVDRDPAVSKVGAEFSGALAMRGDVSRPQTWSRVAAALSARDAEAHILINNAGVCPGGPFEKLELKVWEQALAVNFRAALLGTKTLLPLMLQRGRGVIVNIASVAGLLPFPLMGPYCASKAALVSFSLTLEMEFCSRGIQVLTVIPGAIRTGILQRNRIELPPSAHRIIQRAIELFAARPEKTASQIAEAIEKNKRLLVPAGSLQPILLLERLSPAWYVKMFTLLTSAATRKKA